uniref:NADH-ubiquinone oxidoreductase 29.9 kDa subunit, mitochondrial n=1 Tax=Talaromyces marneffei PM1 TaxID=1077442 RepID=A0A093XS61_TALMA
MRPALRLLANVKPARYLEPFAPTGLTGLVTHPSPRPTLIFLYTQTLEKLKQFPESSAYRQSVEALTRHRLQIVESAKPPGFDEWLQRVKKVVAENPERFAKARLANGTFAGIQQDDIYGGTKAKEWDGLVGPITEGPSRTPEEVAQWEAIIEDAAQPESASDSMKRLSTGRASLHWRQNKLLKSKTKSALASLRKLSRWLKVSSVL